MAVVLPKVRKHIAPFCVAKEGYISLLKNQIIDITELFIIGGRHGIRTHDPRLRRPVLYPAELTAREFITTTFQP
jgi:hypothetical protein